MDSPSCTVRASPSHFTGAPASRYLVKIRGIWSFKSCVSNTILHHFWIIKHWEFMGLLGFDIYSSYLLHEVVCRILSMKNMSHYQQLVVEVGSKVSTSHPQIITKVPALQCEFVSNLPSKRYVWKFLCVLSRMPNPHFSRTGSGIQQMRW